VEDDITMSQITNIIRIFWLAIYKPGESMHFGDPVLISHGSCTDNCSLTADNSRSLSLSLSLFMLLMHFFTFVFIRIKFAAMATKLSPQTTKFTVNPENKNSSAPLSSHCF
jgi:hypothetical protein